MSKIELVAGCIGLFGLSLASAIDAQGQVWTVDDSGSADFTELATAIGSVASGDVLLVKEGQYSMFGIVGKSLTIQAEAGAAVIIENLGLGEPYGSFIAGLGTDDAVYLRGLVLRSTGAGLELNGNDGVIWIEDCAITALSFGDRDESGYACAGSGRGLFVWNCADVVLLRSAMVGAGTNWCGGCVTSQGGSAMEIAGPSRVHAFGCTFTGGAGRGTPVSESCASSSGGYGIRGGSGDDDLLFLSDCVVKGGDGIGCSYPSGNCAPNSGGTGIAWGAGTVGEVDSEFAGGTWVQFRCGPFGPPCPTPGSAGLATSPGTNIAEVPGRALRLQATSPVRENGTIDMTIEGPPHTPIWLLGGTHVDPRTPRAHVGTLLLGGSPRLEFAGFTDEQGQLQRSVSLGLLPANLDALVLFAQAFYLLPYSGPDSRVPHLLRRMVFGEGTMVLALDQSF